nr:unnamed protein product [Spirometra erinaceieuropaei]
MAHGRRSKSAEKSIFFAQKWSQLRLGSRVSTPNEEGRNGHRRFERKFRSASLHSRSAVKTPSTHADSEKNVIDELEFEDLKRFQYALWTSSQKQGGRVDLDTFRNTMKGNLRRPSGEIDILVKTLFDEIDISGLGSLSCSDICTFLLCKHKARDLRLAKARLIQIKEPIKTCVLPNREPVARTVARRHGGGFIVAKTDGTLIFWSSDLKITKQRSLVFEEQTQRVTPKWYTDFLFLNEISKFVSSTGDRELEFCEMTTFEPYCRIIGLDTVPVCLTWGIRPQTTQYVIAWGDSNGDVSILLLTDIAELLRTWKVSSASGSLPTVHFEQLLTQPKVQFLRWHVHSEWVVKVHYEASMDKIISCCNEESTAVIIGCVTGSTPIGQASRIKPTRTQLTSSSGSTTPSGRPLRTHLVGRPSIAAPRSRTALQAKHRLAIDQQVFKIYKGARTFAYSRDRNLLVTGGMDRLIRIWNPVVPS